MKYIISARRHHRDSGWIADKDTVLGIVGVPDTAEEFIDRARKDISEILEVDGIALRPDDKIEIIFSLFAFYDCVVTETDQ